jgi:hypothetical protein
MSDAQQQAKRDAQLRASRATTTEGVVVAGGVDWGRRLVTVNMSGFTQAMPWKGPAPWEGDRVRIDSAGGDPVCSLIEGSPYGTVSSVAGDYLNVAGDDDVSYRYVFVGTDTFTGGERVALDHARKLVVGQISTDPAFDPPEPEPGPPPGTVSSAWFNPTWSGNWTGGVFDGEPATISSTRVGAYGWGTQLRDSIPDSASIIRAELQLVQNWDRVPGVETSMGTHSFDGRPGSMTNASLTGDYQFPGGSRLVDIRGAVVDALKTGAALGVGFRSGSFGWREYAQAPASGRVYVEWQ